ncbi:uncharacterized protein BX664DRAFT_341644 [Halteromyces radiatus]|uniref:uncharacterized protein n=1 Tax=Halteromyces radiatus TaxID=101107 RepID=UPI00221FC54D|nr:uncharacterized protein BX664DRAFT_341644 [Halteromyces radiatus]KAI8079865.1 hypothetical protein BX664DRAFT_341644 [Halteromyces radiatus]
MAEKVYVIGATGNIGQKAVQNLLAKGVATTIYVRDVEKSKNLFKENKLLTIVQGDYDNLQKFKETIGGHTRLFYLITDLPRMPVLKEQLASWAYEAGVKQIVDISSRFTQFPWRTSFIGEAHRLAEEKVYHLALKHNRNFVALRPSRFFINHLWVDGPTIKEENAIYDSNENDAKIEWISTDDIADVATLVLTDPVEKHGNMAYPLIGDSVTGPDRAAIFTEALGRTITYKKVSATEKYNGMIKNNIPHGIALDIAVVDTFDPPTKIVPVLLGRPYETLKEWVFKNKDAF